MLSLIVRRTLGVFAIAALALGPVEAGTLSNDLSYRLTDVTGVFLDSTTNIDFELQYNGPSDDAITQVSGRFSFDAQRLRFDSVTVGSAWGGNASSNVEGTGNISFTLTGDRVDADVTSFEQFALIWFTALCNYELTTEVVSFDTGSASYNEIDVDTSGGFIGVFTPTSYDNGSVTSGDYELTLELNDITITDANQTGIVEMRATTNVDHFGFQADMTYDTTKLKIVSITNMGVYPNFTLDTSTAGLIDVYFYDGVMFSLPAYTDTLVLKVEFEPICGTFTFDSTTVDIDEDSTKTFLLVQAFCSLTFFVKADVDTSVFAFTPSATYRLTPTATGTALSAASDLVYDLAVKSTFPIGQNNGADDPIGLVFDAGDYLQHISTDGFTEISQGNFVYLEQDSVFAWPDTSLFVDRNQLTFNFDTSGYAIEWEDRTFGVEWLGLKTISSNDRKTTAPDTSGCFVADSANGGLTYSVVEQEVAVARFYLSSSVSWDGYACGYRGQVYMQANFNVNDFEVTFTANSNRTLALVDLAAGLTATTINAYTVKLSANGSWSGYSGSISSNDPVQLCRFAPGPGSACGIGVNNYSITITPSAGEVINDANSSKELIDYDGQSLTVSCFSQGCIGLSPNVETEAELPITFDVGNNYPNPFNPTTTINFTVPTATEWSVTIYNVTGQIVSTFSGMTAAAGPVEVIWDASDVASGVYLYRVTAGENTATKKMMLLK